MMVNGPFDKSKNLVGFGLYKMNSLRPLDDFSVADFNIDTIDITWSICGGFFG